MPAASANSISFSRSNNSVRSASMANAVAPAFFMKALVLEGAGPLLSACATCGEPDGEVELVAFDLMSGGTLCRAHRSGRPMSPAALVLLRRILGGDLAAVLTPAGWRELCFWCRQPYLWELPRNPP